MYVYEAGRFAFERVKSNNMYCLRSKKSRDKGIIDTYIPIYLLHHIQDKEAK